MCTDERSGCLNGGDQTDLGLKKTFLLLLICMFLYIHITSFTTLHKTFFLDPGNSSWKGPMKGLSVLLSILLSFCLGVFRAGFSGKKFLFTKLGKWTKNRPKMMFFGFIEKIGH